MEKHILKTNKGRESSLDFQLLNWPGLAGPGRPSQPAQRAAKAASRSRGSPCAARTKFSAPGGMVSGLPSPPPGSLPSPVPAGGWGVLLSGAGLPFPAEPEDRTGAGSGPEAERGRGQERPEQRRVATAIGITQYFVCLAAFNLLCCGLKDKSSGSSFSFFFFPCAPHERKTRGGAGSQHGLHGAGGDHMIGSKRQRFLD